MDWVDTLALGAALGADSLSVSIGIGMGGVQWRRALKLASLFGAMQGVLLAVGVGLAKGLHVVLDLAARGNGILARYLCGVDVECVHRSTHVFLSIVGAAVLCLVGVNLIRGYFRREDDSKPVYYKGRLALCLLALSVSIDAFSAGVGLGMLQDVVVTYVSLGITVVIAAMAIAGLRAGHRIGRLIGRRAEPVGGTLLILLAAHLVLQVLR